MKKSLYSTVCLLVLSGLTHLFEMKTVSIILMIVSYITCTFFFSALLGGMFSSGDEKNKKRPHVCQHGREITINDYASYPTYSANLFDKVAGKVVTSEDREMGISPDDSDGNLFENVDGEDADGHIIDGYGYW